MAFDVFVSVQYPVKDPVVFYGCSCQSKTLKDFFLSSVCHLHVLQALTVCYIQKPKFYGLTFVYLSLKTDS